MKAYKITINEEVRIIVPLSQYEILIAATPKTEHYFGSIHWLNKRIETGESIEVQLEDEKWVHPHLYKPIKVNIVK